jgi:hypothetical protein
MMAGYLERTRRMQAVVAETLERLASRDRGAAKKRLREMQGFYQVALQHLGRMLEELDRA